MRASQFIVIEDSFGDMSSLLGHHRALKLQLNRRQLDLPPMSAWPPAEALARIRGQGGQEERSWTGDECLLVDCWDRDAIDGHGTYRSTFFALDVLAAIRELHERDKPVPRVIAFSRAMHLDIVRAALGEFQRRRVRVKIEPPVNGVTAGWRLDTADSGSGAQGVLWAMFSRDELVARLGAIATGDRTGSSSPPPPSSPVWDEFLPSSCLASFHNEVRDEFPDVWADRVLGDAKGGLRESRRKAIRRTGITYLEPNPARGYPDYKGCLAIARRLADPPGG